MLKIRLIRRHFTHEGTAELLGDSDFSILQRRVNLRKRGSTTDLLNDVRPGSVKAPLSKHIQFLLTNSFAVVRVICVKGYCDICPVMTLGDSGSDTRVQMPRQGAICDCFNGRTVRSTNGYAELGTPCDELGVHIWRASQPTDQYYFLKVHERRMNMKEKGLTSASRPPFSNAISKPSVICSRGASKKDFISSLDKQVVRLRMIMFTTFTR
jgi:hypothetical protein